MASAGSAPSPESARPRSPLWNPAPLATLLVAPLFVIGREHGWIAHLPIWVLVGALVVAQVGNLAAAAAWPDPKSSGELWARVAIMQLGVAACIYVTGW